MSATTSILDPLILDLVEWVAHAPRSNAEVIDTWRTSCPRLTVWEEAMDRGLVERCGTSGGAVVVVTADGLEALRKHRPASSGDGCALVSPEPARPMFR